MAQRFHMPESMCLKVIPIFFFFSELVSTNSPVAVMQDLVTLQI